MVRVGRPTFGEYSSGRRVETFGALVGRPEVVEQHDEALPGDRILDLGAPIGHAHRVVPEQHKESSLMDDAFAYSHENRRGHRSPQDIGGARGHPDPLI
jgi:hypothetical protein